MANRIKIRRDTSNNWTASQAANSALPLLEQGEIGFEIDSNKIKIGNGISKWNDLPYLTDNILPPNARGFLKNIGNGSLTWEPFPTLSIVATTGSYSDLIDKPSLFSGNYIDLDNKPTLSIVAATGNYSDLIDKPSLFSGNYIDLDNKPTLSIVAATGNYSDLINKPTLFSGNYIDLTNKPTLSIVAATGNYSDLINKPTLFSGNYIDLTNKPTLSIVATTGNYSDLINKPTLFSGNYIDLTNKPTLSIVATTGNYSDLINKPTLFSGNYIDLTNKPEIPRDVNELSDIDQLLPSTLLRNLETTIEDILFFDFGSILTRTARNKLEWIIHQTDIDNGTIYNPANINYDAGTLI
jgi:hypothetical protein